MFEKMKNMQRDFKTLRLSEGRLEFYNATIPASNEPQMIIKPKLVGICRSDIKEFLGTRTVRHDFGHEILGEVVASNDARLPQIGAMVILDPHIKIQRSSGFGELIVATASVNDLIKAFIVVPSSIPEDKLVFVEPLSCARHCVSNLLRFKNRRERLDGLTVGIVGAGMTGILIGLLCKYYGGKVSIINRSQKRLDFLESTSIFVKESLYLNDAVDEAFDVVIPTTTFLTPEVLEFCEKIIKDKGLILLYGGTKKDDTLPESNIDIDKIRRDQSSQRVTRAEKSFRLCGTHGAVTEDFKDIIELLSKFGTDLPVERLVSRRILLEDVPNDIIAMSQEEHLGKTVVTIG